MTGCATTPNAAEICTADWISARSDRAISRLESRAQSSLKTIRSAGQDWLAGKQPGPLRLLALSNALGKMRREVTQGAAVKDLRLLASTCNDPDIIKMAMFDLVDRQNLPDNFNNFIKTNPFFTEMIAEISENIAPPDQS